MKKNKLIRHLNKKTHVTYLYWGHSTYVPGQKYPKVEKKCIGKITSKGDFEPNKTFLSFSVEQQLETGLVDEAYLSPYTRGDSATYECKMYGFVALLEAAAKQSGLWQSLKKVFPHNWQMMLTIVEAMMSYPDRALYRPKHFHDVCWHTLVDKPTEYGINKALEAVDPESLQRFFGDFERRTEAKKTSSDSIGEMVVCALDTTSISTFSAMLEAAKYGKNKEGDAMAQINLLMICDNSTGIPLYYRSLPGNYSDKNVLDTTIKELRSAEFRKGSLLVMDRGFYSQVNVVKLLKGDFRFLMGMPLSAGIYKEAIREAAKVILDTENFCEPAGIHAWSKVISIDAPRRGRGPNSHEVCLYLFLNPDKQAEEQQKYARRFSKGKTLLEVDPGLYGKGNFYGRHYVLEEDAKGIVVAVRHNVDAQREKMKECGFFGYLGPVGLTPERVLKITHNRDTIEKDYEAFKSRMRRPKHSLEEHLEGKIFLVYLVTILEMWTRRVIDTYLLYDKYSFNDLRDEVFNAKWRKPKGKVFSQGAWCDLPLEVQKLFHIFGVAKDALLREDIPRLVKNELKKRKLKHGMVVN